MLRRLLISLVLLTLAPVISAQEEDLAIHEELRNVLSGLAQAVNEERYGDLAQYFHENLTITTLNQEVISTHSEIEPYFDKWFGPGGYLKTLEMSLEADALTQFYGDKTWGIVRGLGHENYVLSDKRAFPMETRWTATVIKDTDGKWRILTLHIGTDFLNNPILDVAQSSAKYFGAGGVVAGLLLAWLIGFVRKRGKQAA